MDVSLETTNSFPLVGRAKIKLRLASTSTAENYSYTDMIIQISHSSDSNGLRGLLGEKIHQQTADNN